MSFWSSLKSWLFDPAPTLVEQVEEIVKAEVVNDQITDSVTAKKPKKPRKKKTDK